MLKFSPKSDPGLHPGIVQPSIGSQPGLPQDCCWCLGTRGYFNHFSPPTFILFSISNPGGRAGNENHSNTQLKTKRRTPLLTERKEHMTRSDPNGTRNIIIEKQSWVPSLLKLKQMGARNQSRALQETISFYAKNLSLRGLMHFLLAAIMPRLITPEPGEREWHPH